MRKENHFISSILLASALLCVAAITAAFGQTTVGRAAAHPPGATGEMLVSQLPDPQQINSAGVIDENGKTIGHVTNVNVGTEGKATDVKIALTIKYSEGRIVTLRADQLGYDPRKGVVVANVSRTALAQRGAGAPGGGGSGNPPMNGTHPSNY